MGALSLELAPGGAAPTTDTGHQHSQGLRCAGHRAGCPEAKRMRFRSSRGGGLAGEKDRVHRNVKSSPGALWEVQSGPQGISGSVVLGGRGAPKSRQREASSRGCPASCLGSQTPGFLCPMGRLLQEALPVCQAGVAGFLLLPVASPVCLIAGVCGLCRNVGLGVSLTIRGPVAGPRGVYFHISMACA